MSATKKTSAKKPADFTAETTAQMKDGFEKATKTMTEFGEMGRENFDALVACAQAMTKGFEEITSESTAFAKDAIETSVETMKSATAVKTPQEFVEKQTSFFQSMMDAQIEQMTKVSDMMMDTAKEATAPLSKRYTAMTDMVQSFRA